MSIYLPEPVIKRLPMYYRYLKKLESEKITVISSTALSALMGFTASQVRQDINSFGGVGRQGSGYSVTQLRQYIGKLLGMDKLQTMVIVGAGNLGSAIAGYSPFRQNNFLALALFDCDPQKAGTCVDELVVRSADEIEAYLQTQHVDIAALTLPACAAQAMGERLYRCGVRGFWNFAPVDLHLPKDASVVNVHLDDSLEQLSYRMAHPDIW